MNLRKTISSEFRLNLRKNQTRNENFKFLTSTNKNHKETSTYFSFPEKEEESKKSTKNNFFNSFNSISLFTNNYSEKSIHKNSLSHPKSNYEIYKEKLINENNFFNDMKYMTLKNFKSPNYLTEEKTQTENKLTTLDSYLDNNNHNYLTSNNLFKRNKSLKRRKRFKIPKNYFLNKYITLTAQISRENDINYNSGNFKMPLIGLNRKND